MRFLVTALLLVSLACTQQTVPRPSDIDGAWAGSIDVPPGIKLRVVFHLAGSASGLTATMDSPDQNAKGIPVNKATRDGSTIVFDMANIGGRFEGQLDKTAGTMAGTWSQGGNSFPLTLTRVKDESALELKRPQ